MEGIIKVSPEQLAATASEFGGQATQLQTLTAQMMDLLKSLSASWNGEASQAYLAKFQGLQPDMDKMFRMVQEHSKDLQEMSATYQNAERANVDATQSLLNNILV